jgi:hypothetical protein
MNKGSGYQKEATQIDPPLSRMIPITLESTLKDIEIKYYFSLRLKIILHIDTSWSQAGGHL